MSAGESRRPDGWFEGLGWCVLAKRPEAGSFQLPPHEGRDLVGAAHHPRPEYLDLRSTYGGVIDRKVFFATPSCPLTKQNSEKTVGALPSDSTMVAWVKERRAKK